HDAQDDRRLRRGVPHEVGAEGDQRQFIDQSARRDDEHRGEQSRAGQADAPGGRLGRGRDGRLAQDSAIAMTPPRARCMAELTHTAGCISSEKTVSPSLPGVRASSTMNATAMAIRPITPNTRVETTPSSSLPSEAQIAPTTIRPTPRVLDATSS